MKLRSAIVFIATYTCCAICRAQELPKVIPPSPTAMQFQRYGDYPVGYFTGVPDITIPLFTVKEGDIDLPITLSYHASGIRVNDVSGFVGLGWTLNTGGILSRTIKDKPDELSVFTIPATPANQVPYWDVANTLTQLKNMAEITGGALDLDNEYDVYAYNFAGKSGKYIIKNGNYFLFPYKPLGFSSLLGGLTITDERGINYGFAATSIGPDMPVEFETLSENRGSAPTSWMVTDISSSANPGNKVHIEYAAAPNYVNPDLPSQYILDDDWNQAFDGTFFGPYLQYSDQNGMNLQQGGTSITYHTFVPKEVTFSNGRVKFIANATTKMLSSVEVYDAFNNLVKLITLDIVPYSAAEANNPKCHYKLAAVHIKDNQNVNTGTYSFDYYEGSMPIAGANDGYGIDFWGYFNGHTENQNAIPKWDNWVYKTEVLPTTRSVGYANRSAMEANMKVYTLNKITYPTGGYTIFDFESNKLGNQDVGGLRIKKITNYNADDKESGWKSYLYGGVSQEVPPDISLYWYTMGGDLSDNAAFRRNYFSENPSVDLSPQGAPMVYGFVEERSSDGGSTEYTYDTDPAFTYDNYLPLNIETLWNLPIMRKKIANYGRPWNFGNLLKKTVWGDGVWKISEEENQYQELIRDTARDFKIERFLFPTCAYYQGAPGAPPCLPDFLPNFDSRYSVAGFGCVFDFADHFYLSGEKRLKKTIKTYYAANGSQVLSSTTNYEYDNNEHDQPSRTITTNSKGEQIKTELKYPHDFQSVPSPNVYNEMVTRHIWSPVVEQAAYNNSVLLQSSKTNYNYWNNGWNVNNTTSIIVPQTLESKKQANPSEIRVRFDAYDTKGNVVSVSKENDTKQSYVWDYNQSVPVAQVLNAGQDDIAATSFESNGKGNFTFSGTVVADPSAPTGKNVYQLSSGNITRALNNTLTYIVSLWATTGGVLVNGASPVKTGRSLGGYTRYEYRVISASSLTISGTGNIDELRLYPAGALMTTYTYQPLIGATSQCDPNNRVSYFEYDAAGRLEHIRDQDKNIVKKYCYNYLGQNVNCGIEGTGAALWQATGITRCVKCPLNAALNTGVIESKETDNNPSSPTYTQMRWVYAGTGSACPVTGGWQNTSTPLRCKTDGGQNTGEQEQEQNFISACGDITQTRWTVIGTNTTACPVPSIFYSVDMSGYYQRGDCSSPAVGTNVYISVPEGMFTSTVSVADANQQALNYAYAQAIANGSCEIPPFTLTFNNQTSDIFAYDIELTNSNNEVVYTFHPVGSGTQDLGTIAPGTYNIHISPAGGSSVHTYEAGCSYSVTGSDEWLNAVPVTPSCNVITIYP